MARNGDVANKIGTYALAILARAHRIPFIVAAPLSTLDADTADGDDIPIEQRREEEVLGYAGVMTAPDGSTALNPAFDITPADHITAIVTEAGILEPPFAGKIVQTLRSADAAKVTAAP